MASTSLGIRIPHRYVPATHDIAVRRSPTSLFTRLEVTIYNPKSQLFIPYDDPTSAARKAKYVVSKGMAGMESKLYRQYALWAAI